MPSKVSNICRPVWINLLEALYNCWYFTKLAASSSKFTPVMDDFCSFKVFCKASLALLSFFQVATVVAMLLVMTMMMASVLVPPHEQS